jgi:D-threonate/D-erythronate kinase
MLRLLADDLTGALDSSAEFTGAFGAVHVIWPDSSVRSATGSLSIDSGTRELGSAEAFAKITGLAPVLHDAVIAFKKIDSLLRGPWTSELMACLQTSTWDACIVAPAFPHQGRRTRHGRQELRSANGDWHDAGDVVLKLRTEGIEARIGDADKELLRGVSVFDAETEQDLIRIAQIGRQYSGRVLWCGSGGLAGALAAGTEVPTSREIAAPVLGVFGSDHAVTSAQLTRCSDATVPVTPDHRIDIDGIGRRLKRGVAFVMLNAPRGSSRQAAAKRFRQEIATLSQSIARPRTLLISGGETLKAQCLATAAHTLKVTGRLEPGVARSVMEDGAWKGVEVISKSGAFGPPDLWWKLLRENALI